MVLQLIEVGVVTVLAVWVYIFSPSSLSRLVATVVFLLNLAWVLFERDEASRRHPKRRAAQTPAGLPGDGGHPSLTSSEGTPEETAGPASPPRIL
ncbi:MAG: hypothetical protein Q8P31_05220 [Bacillota bacterium]|nr:hypothetical protein [Bacillota bacterium]